MKNRPDTLNNIFAEHRGKVADKWSIYIAEYDRLFQEYRNRPIRLLEIGIQNGGSLEIWDKFFTHAEKLVGCDINPDCAQLQFDDPKIAVVVANANTDEAQQRILAHSPGFDIIIDDGSHQSGDIVRSFARYFGCLNDGGLYVAEDMHCSYWKDFEGGIFQPYSSIAFFKRLADTINHEHWGIDKTRNELLRSFNRKFSTSLDEITLAHIHSIEFINSLCLIRKAAPDNNILGRRIVTGTNALVFKDILKFRGTSSTPPDQNANEWSTRDLPIEEELVVRIQEVSHLNQALSARDDEIIRIKQTAVERERELHERLLSAQQELRSVEQSWVEKAAAQERQLVQEKAVLQSQIYSHQQALHAAGQEKLQQIREAAEQQREASQAHAERERELHEKLLVAQQDLYALEQSWTAKASAQQHEFEQRTQSLLSQIAALKQSLETAEQEKLQQLLEAAEHQREASQAHANREQAYLAQLALARQQIETQLLELAQREKEFSGQLQKIQQTHEQQKVELSRQHIEREQALNAQLRAKQDELQSLTYRWEEEKEVLVMALSQLRGELNAMRTSRSWRWTSSLRNLVALLPGKKVGSYKPAATVEPSADQITSLTAEAIGTTSADRPQSNTNKAKGF